MYMLIFEYYRVWLKEGQQGSKKWKGQYVKLLSIDTVSHQAIVKLQLEHPILTQHIGTVCVHTDMLVFERLIYQDGNGNKFYENDIIQNVFSGNIFSLHLLYNGVPFLMTPDGESKVIKNLREDLSVFKVIGNRQEHANIWSRQRTMDQDEEESNKSNEELIQTINELTNELNQAYEKLRTEREEKAKLEKENEELKKQNKQLEVENQYAEYYLNEMYKKDVYNLLVLDDILEHAELAKEEFDRLLEELLDDMEK